VPYAECCINKLMNAKRWKSDDECYWISVWLVFSLFAETSCNFATTDILVGYYQASFNVRLGLWGYEPVDSVLMGGNYCVSYNSAYSASSPPHFSRFAGLVTVILGSCSLAVIRVLFTKVEIQFVRLGSCNKVRGSCCFLSIIESHFFFSDACTENSCRLGTGLSWLFSHGYSTF
jgi:hypothetical protein